MDARRCRTETAHKDRDASPTCARVAVNHTHLSLLALSASWVMLKNDRAIFDPSLIILPPLPGGASDEMLLSLMASTSCWSCERVRSVQREGGDDHIAVRARW
jgi:hypothetical protein